MYSDKRLCNFARVHKYQSWNSEKPLVTCNDFWFLMMSSCGRWARSAPAVCKVGTLQGQFWYLLFIASPIIQYCVGVDTGAAFPILNVGPKRLDYPAHLMWAMQENTLGPPGPGSGFLVPSLAPGPPTQCVVTTSPTRAHWHSINNSHAVWTWAGGILNRNLILFGWINH